MSVLVVTNHHAGLISWPVGPTERWTLKTTIQQKRAYKRKGGTPGGAVHGGCVSSRECRCRPQHLHWRRGYSWHLVTHFTKAPSLPASSRLMQSWALIIFLTLHLYNGMAMQVGADRGITLPSSNSWWSSFFYRIYDHNYRGFARIFFDVNCNTNSGSLRLYSKYFEIGFALFSVW